MANLSIYVGTYNKYNEGSLQGKWLSLSDYSGYPELLQAMYELHKDEEDPEFMIQDFEGDSIFELLELVSESYLSPDIYDVIDILENSCYDLQVFESYLECFGNNDITIDELIEAVEEAYQGAYDSDCCFVQELLEECGVIPSDLPNYIHIDWDRTSYDIMMDYSTANGCYFRSL